jgi:hypothetical protein
LAKRHRIAHSRLDFSSSKFATQSDMNRPFYGSRRMKVWLGRQGHPVNRKRVRRLMRTMGVQAVYRRPRTSQPAPGHKVYPHLLGDWRSPGLIRCGRPISPTSPWPRVSCTWWPSSHCMRHRMLSPLASHNTGPSNMTPASPFFFPTIGSPAPPPQGSMITAAAERSPKPYTSTVSALAGRGPCRRLHLPRNQAWLPTYQWRLELPAHICQANPEDWSDLLRTLRLAIRKWHGLSLASTATEPIIRKTIKRI